MILHWPSPSVGGQCFECRSQLFNVRGTHGFLFCGLLSPAGWAGLVRLDDLDEVVLPREDFLIRLHIEADVVGHGHEYSTLLISWPLLPQVEEARLGACAR